MPGPLSASMQTTAVSPFPKVRCRTSGLTNGNRTGEDLRQRPRTPSASARAAENLVSGRRLAIYDTYASRGRVKAGVALKERQNQKIFALGLLHSPRPARGLAN